MPTARLAVALASSGFDVEALCPPRHPVSQTRTLQRAHAYRGLAPIGSLLRAIARANPDLVVPGDDLAVRHLHELYRERAASSSELASRELPSREMLAIEPLIERSLGSPESFSVISSRAAFMKLAREEGIRVPRTGVVETEEDVKNWIAQVGLPAVFKADGTSGGEGVRVVRTAAEAQSAFRKLHAPPLLARALKRALLDQDSTLIRPSLGRRRPTVSAQAFVAGHEATSTVACWRGKVLASLHFEVLRKSSAAGHATVVRLIDHAEISSAVEKVVRRMGLSGLCGFDFMLESATGSAYLIEINPRATQVAHLALGAGRDLPAALYGAVSGQKIAVAPPVTENPTIALFPHEWARDAESEFLRTGYHDVPWNTPELVHACVHRSRKQSVWYSRSERKQETAGGVPAVTGSAENNAAARSAAQ